MKKLILPLLLPLLLLCGCDGYGSYSEIEDTFLVSGIAVDKGENKKYSVTVEIVGSNTGDTAPTRKQLLLSGEGSTVYSALGEVSSAASKKLFFSQTVAVVIGEEAARGGIYEIIDLAMRDTELRITSDVIIAKGGKAKDLFLMPSAGEPIRAYEMRNVLKNSQKTYSVSPEVKIYELINKISEKGIAASLPAFSAEESEKKQSLAICGTALFNDDKLSSFLGVNESKIMSMVMGKTNETTITEKIGENIVSQRIYKCTSSVKPEFKGNKPKIKILLKLESGIDELISKDHVLSDEEHDKIIKELEKKLKNDVLSLTKKFAYEVDEDIFGFGNLIYKKYPQKWESFKKEDYLKNIDYDVNVQITLRSTGFINKTDDEK